MCMVCGKMVKRGSLIGHTQRCTETEKRRFVCHLCPKRYLRAEVLQSHLLLRHYPERKQHICSLCGKAFASVSAIQHHNLSHAEPSIKCPRESCDKVFKSRGNVMQHLRGEVQSYCIVAFRDYPLCFALCHVIVYFSLSGCHYPPQWECLICKERFAFLSKLRIHLKQVHHTGTEDVKNLIHKHPNDESEDLALLKGHK